MRNRPQGPTHLPHTRKWRLPLLALIPALIMAIGTGAMGYPYMAQWFNQLDQSRITATYSASVAAARPRAHEQIERARRYNDALQVGAIYEANTNIPTNEGSTEGDDTEIDGVDYWRQLLANDSGLMARLKIPAISLDLPVYHGTSDATLEHGLGHLRGTSLPVGGVGTRSLITGHRGLATAEMFTRLDELEEGDTFTIEVFGEVLTYRIFEKIVVDPDERKKFLAVPGRDLVTLVTCTPLGINTHRILVTAERITPTPADDIANAGKAPDIPGLPWWALFYAASLLLIALYIWWAGLPAKKKPKKDPATMSPRERKRWEKQQAKKAARRSRAAGKAERGGTGATEEVAEGVVATGKTDDDVTQAVDDGEDMKPVRTSTTAPTRAPEEAAPSPPE